MDLESSAITCEGIQALSRIAQVCGEWWTPWAAGGLIEKPDLQLLVEFKKRGEEALMCWRRAFQDMAAR